MHRLRRPARHGERGARERGRAAPHRARRCSRAPCRRRPSAPGASTPGAASSAPTAVTGTLRDLFVAEWGERKSSSDRRHRARPVLARRADLEPRVRLVVAGRHLPPRLRGRLDRAAGVGRRPRAQAPHAGAALRRARLLRPGLDSEPASALSRRLRTGATSTAWRRSSGDPALSHLELRHARASLLAG